MEQWGSFAWASHSWTKYFNLEDSFVLIGQYWMLANEQLILGCRMSIVYALFFFPFSVIYWTSLGQKALYLNDPVAT